MTVTSNQEQSPGGNRPDLTTIPRRRPGAAIPLSFSQRQLWFLQQLMPRSAVYNVPFAIRLSTRIDTSILEQALTEIARRHEALRTRFGIVEGHPVQIVAEESHLRVRCENLDGHSVEPGQLAFQRRIEEEALRPFDLGELPLVRVHIFDHGVEQILLIVIHHIIWDGWSQSIFNRELETLYETYQKGEASPFEALPLQVGDYACWEEDAFRQGQLQEAIGYWKTQLAHVQQKLELPADFHRPMLPTFQGSSNYFQVSEAVTLGLKDLSRKSGATLYMTLLAVYGLLLYRYSRQEQILIGTPTANRGFEELQGLIGFFANVLVMRVDLEPSLTFQDMLRQVKGTALGAYAHQEVSFELLVEELRPERDLNRSPLFQTLFVLQAGPHVGSGKSLLSGQRLAINFPIAKFDLSLSMIELDGKLTGELNYNSDIFAAPTIARFQESLLLLLGEIATTPLRRVHELAALLSPGEREQIRVWNSTHVEYGAEERLNILVEEQVRATPEALALSCGDEKLTYIELNGRANQLAHYLLERGVGPETRVGVCMERSVEMVVALLGILKAGAAYLPLDPEYPSQRLQWMQGDARTRVVLAQSRFKGLIDSTSAEIICLDTAGEILQQRPLDNCPCAFDGENAAYVIYTSGSTGRPKGVINHHRGICNRLLWMQEAYQLGSQDRVLQKTPYSFDVSVWEFFWPLITGGALVMARPGGHRDSSYLKRVIENEKITTVHFVPSMLKSMLEDGGLRECPSLKRVICSGEALSVSLAQQFHRVSGAELHNLYGPTEAAVDVTYWLSERNETRLTIPIGRPIANIQIHILDEHLMQVPTLVPGELCIAGEGLAVGYLGRPDLTAEKFVPNPFGPAGARLYRTGDQARYANDGAIEYLGRIDFQVKIRGNRIELGEIEEALKQHESVKDSAVIVRQESAENILAAFVVPKDHGQREAHALRAFLKQCLPDFMVPSRFVFLDRLPLSSNGKLDRKALSLVLSNEPLEPSSRKERYLPPRNELEKNLAAIWAGALRVEQVGVNDNFFDLGGHSLALLRVHSEMKEKFRMEVSVIDLFRLPTVAALADFLASGGHLADAKLPDSSVATEEARVAVIGMAGRFPGARNVQAFWENLKNGVESISSFSDAELEDVPAHLRNDPAYVRAGAILEDADAFDAGFFGFHRREAEITDPQQRVFLECAWEVLEEAGYDPDRYPHPIGVFAGMGASGYWFRLARNSEVLESVNAFQLNIGNDKDHLPLRVSYKLNLKGPSVSVQTACSTSLVAVHMACESLLRGECKMAMAGGVSIRAVQKAGYIYEEGGISSPDGHCRAFDADAAGTIAGNGAGVVLLKRLQDALADRDHIYSVILGSAINNDGALKVGYTAPSVEGQAQVIARAQARARVTADSISYIEAHGTATPLGDPIEIAALTQAFHLQTERKQFCAIGSVKTNVGHLDAAAGVTSLIKTALAMEHGLLPPSLHFRQPNAKIDFRNTPFYVNSELREWRRGSEPRRAGVSSFGIGGTNAHVVIEEPPCRPDVGEDEGPHVLPISAKTSAALDSATVALAAHLEKHPEQRMCDVAFTLQEGRKDFPLRRALVTRSRTEGLHAIYPGNSHQICEGEAQTAAPIYFLFPGQGAQYVNMARGLYESIPVFRRLVDRCAEVVAKAQRSNPLRILYPAAGDNSLLQQELQKTANAQPLLFLLEYSLASLWMELGVRPDALLGHSLGEYVAACLAGVMSLDEALQLVTVRGQLMQNMPTGAMLSVLAPEHVVNELLHYDRNLALAAVNSPSLCVLSGPEEAIARLEAYLDERGLEGRRLHTSHAFHSSMMAPVAESLRRYLKGIQLRPPTIPFLSNLSGDWITEKEATSPDYWVEHLLKTVRFSENLERLLQQPRATLLEMGPETLIVLAKRNPQLLPGTGLVPSMQARGSCEDEYLSFLWAVAALWTRGISVQWQILGRRSDCKRIQLPTYPFERQQYYIPESKKTGDAMADKGSFKTGVAEPGSSTDDSIANANRVPASMSPVHRLILQQLEVVASQLKALNR